MIKFFIILCFLCSSVFADFTQYGSGQINGCSITINLPQKYTSATSFAISVTSQGSSGLPIYAFAAIGTNGGASILVSRDESNCQYTGYFSWITVGN
jgi:hypothetical protein